MMSLESESGDNPMVLGHLQGSVPAKSVTGCCAFDVIPCLCLLVYGGSAPCTVAACLLLVRGALAAWLSAKSVAEL